MRRIDFVPAGEVAIAADGIPILEQLHCCSAAHVGDYSHVKRGGCTGLTQVALSRSVLGNTERFPCHAGIKVNDRFRLPARVLAGIPSVSLHGGLPSAHRLEHRILGSTAVQFLLDGLFLFAYPFARRRRPLSGRQRRDHERRVSRK